MPRPVFDHGNCLDLVVGSAVELHKCRVEVQFLVVEDSQRSDKDHILKLVAAGPSRNQDDLACEVVDW